MNMKLFYILFIKDFEPHLLFQYFLLWLISFLQPLKPVGELRKSIPSASNSLQSSGDAQRRHTTWSSTSTGGKHTRYSREGGGQLWNPHIKTARISLKRSICVICRNTWAAFSELHCGVLKQKWRTERYIFFLAVIVLQCQWSCNDDHMDTQMCFTAAPSWTAGEGQPRSFQSSSSSISLSTFMDSRRQMEQTRHPCFIPWRLDKEPNPSQSYTDASCSLYVWVLYDLRGCVFVQLCSFPQTQVFEWSFV